MIPAAIATLAPEELIRWRMNSSRLRAIENGASGYSKEDVEQAYFERYRLGQEFVERYDINDCRDWDISPYTGVCFYPED